MKTAIIAVLLVTAIVSPLNAQQQPCPQCVARPAPLLAVRPTLGWNPAPAMPTGMMVGASNQPDYESRSRTVIRSSYGTTVINGTYRSYSR